MFLSRCSRRTSTCTLEGLPQLRRCDVQGRRHTLFDISTETTFAPFDSSDRSRTQARHTAERRLSQAANDAPISWIAVVRGDVDNVFDFDPELFEYPGKNVDLRASYSILPPTNCGFGDIGKATEFGPRQVGPRAGLGKARGREATHYSPRHGASLRTIGMVDITGHDAPQHLWLAHWLIMSVEHSGKSTCVIDHHEDNPGEGDAIQGSQILLRST